MVAIINCYLEVKCNDHDDAIVIGIRSGVVLVVVVVVVVVVVTCSCYRVCVCVYL